MMNDAIKISVILSVYNGEKYLKEAIDSILCQTLGDFEFLIVDDASTDTTSIILSQYEDSRIKIFRNETNKGLTYSLNLMLSQSRGEYLARMDADDIALPDRLKVQYDFMEANLEIGICGSFVDSFIQGTRKKQTVKFPESDSGIRSFAFFQSPFCHPSTFFRKEVIDRYSLQYSPRYIKSEDYALWVELLKYTQGANIPQVLLRYRRHEQCFSRWDNEKAKGKVEMTGAIQKNYMACYNIRLAANDLSVYSQFVDRSIPFELNVGNQRAVARILKDFLAQLSFNKRSLKKQTVCYLSIICFYKFFIKKKFPVPFLLQKLFLKGGGFYMGRIIGVKNF
jgi:glycosyltransferase involved in cell wall biosynthesis